jgi:hypothetical protein
MLNSIAPYWLPKLRPSRLKLKMAGLLGSRMGNAFIGLETVGMVMLLSWELPGPGNEGDTGDC